MSLVQLCFFLVSVYLFSTCLSEAGVMLYWNSTLLRFIVRLFIYVHIKHTLNVQLLPVNRALVSAAALSTSHRRLRARSVTVIRVVVSAVSVPDLSEQFTPPETAPPALVSLIQAIEKQGICVFPASLLSVWPPSFCLHVTCPPWASYPHARICTSVDVEAIRGALVGCTESCAQRSWFTPCY